MLFLIFFTLYFNQKMFIYKMTKRKVFLSFEEQIFKESKNKILTENFPVPFSHVDLSTST